MDEIIGVYMQAISHEGWVVQGEMVCANGPVEQPQREDSLLLLLTLFDADSLEYAVTS